MVDPIRADYNDIKRGWGPLIDTYFPAEFRNDLLDDVQTEYRLGGLVTFAAADRV